MFIDNFPTPGLASINGAIVKIEDAKINLFDRGLLFGHALFETLLVKDGQIIEWENHYKRLYNACKKVDIKCPDEIHMKDRSIELIDRLKRESPELNRLTLKIILTAGNSIDLMPSQKVLDSLDSNLYLICQTATEMTLARRFQGIKLKSFLDQRGDFLKEIKSTDYLFNFLCLSTAKHEGFDDALFKDEEGYYTEGVTSSLLWFDYDYRVFSTTPKGNCLVGTSVLKLKRSLENKNIPFSYHILSKNDATNFAGCAMLSSVRGLVPVRQIDDLEFDIETHRKFYGTLVEIFHSCE